jgi:hypothetical protein
LRQRNYQEEDSRLPETGRRLECASILNSARANRASSDRAPSGLPEDSLSPPLPQVLEALRNQTLERRASESTAEGDETNLRCSWCAMNRVDYLFGPARNRRLVAEIEHELGRAAADSRHTGKAARCFKGFMWRTLPTAIPR